MNQLTELLTTDAWWSYLLRILLYFLVAWFIQRLSWRMAGRVLHLNRFRQEKYQLRPERFATMRSLIASLITFLAYVTAVLLSLGLFYDDETLIWMVGLFSAAFGLGARPLISDYLTGISFLFEDTFDIREKVEILGVEGIVEGVYLRTTLLRSSTGELYVIPNGEVRMVRNFSRGRFSPANISIKINSSDLNRALPLLEELSREAMMTLPNLLEPWLVISETGALGQTAELTLATKARYGKAAEMRPRLLALVQEKLEEHGIELVG